MSANKARGSVDAFIAENTKETRDRKDLTLASLAFNWQSVGSLLFDSSLPVNISHHECTDTTI